LSLQEKLLLYLILFRNAPFGGNGEMGREMDVNYTY
jgi:hypothetical protein